MKPSPPDIQKDFPGTVQAARRWSLLAWLALAGMAALLYGHTLEAPWYFDDRMNILDNRWVRDLGSWVEGIFHSRGVAQVTFALNYAIGEASPVGYHLVNIFIHLLASGLVFVVSRRIFRDGSLFPFLVAALFLAHPLQTQAVTYIVQRMASLATLFMLLALWCYIRGRELLAGGARFADRRHLAWYVAALLAGVLAMYCKQIAAVLPLALWLFDRYFLPPPERSRWGWRHQLLYIAPFFLVPALQAGRMLLPLLTGRVDERALRHTLPIQIHPLDYLVTQFSVVWLYIKLLFVPYPQMLDYNVPIVERWLTLRSVAALSGLVLLVAWAYRVRHRLPLLSFGVFWFLLGLSVESTVIPLDTVFEHRLYLPMFGFSVFFWGAAKRFVPRRYLIPVALVVLLPLCLLTWQRNALWNDPLAFARDNLRHAEQPHRRTHLEIARLLNEEGRLDEAETTLRRLLEEHPDYEEAYVNLASTYMRQERYEEAAQILGRATDRGFGSSLLLNNLGNLYSRQGQYRDAVPYYRRALEMNPELAETWTNLGSAYRQMGRLEEAEVAYRRAIALRPDYVEAHFNLGANLFLQGRFEQAARAFESATRRDPTHARAWLGIGAAGLRLGQAARVETARERLEALDPRLAEGLASPGR